MTNNEIDIKTVDYIANLARLEISPEEKNRFHKQLNEIIGYIKTLQDVDVDGVEPTFRVLENTNVLRDDIVLPFEKSLDNLINAPLEKDCYFKLPPVL